MPGRHWLTACGTAMVLGACEMTQSVQLKTPNIDFARGCWVQKPAEKGDYAFLRILPGRTDPGILEGATHDEPAHESAGDFSFTLSRDGSHASWNVQSGNAPHASGVLISSETSAAPPGWRKLRWGQKNEVGLAMTIEGDGKRLKLWSSVGSKQLTVRELIFDGERDGCD